MLNIFKRKTSEISRTALGFEETERKTPKMGIILLLAMFVAGVLFGWWALNDLSRIPAAPEPLSACGYRYGSLGFSRGLITPSEPPIFYNENQSNYYYSDDSSRCVFNAIEQNYAIPLLIQKRIPIEKELKTIYENLNSATNQLNELRYQLQRSTTEYSVGLQEQGAGVPKPIFPAAPTGQSIISLQPREQDLNKQKSELEAKIKSLEVQLKAVDNELKEAYKPVFKEQNRLLRIYDFKVFLLQFIFVFPFFWFALWMYLRLHRKNSPYTIIFTAIMAVAAILLLRVLLFWFWGLFLARVLEVLLEWIQNFAILRSLVFYLGMIFSLAVFGGAAYWLQKKVFDPRRVALRRFRSKQCPHCQTNLDLSVNFCPNCGAQIKEKCAKCGTPRFIDLPACPYCGDKKI